MEQVKKINAESARERAAKRAAEIRGNLPNGVLDDSKSMFEFDTSIIPDGWTYEWKRFSVLGQEYPAYQVELRGQGWEPVPSSRHPELLPMGSKESIIVTGGCILMERPYEITLESRRKDKKNAAEELKTKERELHEPRHSDFERQNEGSSLVNVKRHYEPKENIMVPDKV